MEGVPNAANNNEAPKSHLESAEKRQELIEALALHEQVTQFESDTKNRKLSAEEYKQAMELNKRYSDALDVLTWKECVDNKLPWSPYLEMLKEQAANDNKAPEQQLAG